MANKLSEKALFKAVCLGELSLEFAISNNFITEKRIKDLGWLIEPNCRGCNKLLNSNDDDFDIWFTYWKSCWAPAHKNCITIYRSSEVIDCQIIDADCNDCKYFNRISMVSKNNFVGHCLKFNKQTTAHVNFCTGHKCFEHRKN